MRIFKRKLYDKLLQWKQQRNGQTAILIEGARRVGKSTLVKQFAENEYDSVEELLTDYDENSMREYFLNELTLDFLEEHANITVSES